MNITKISRTEQQECAVMLREMARKIEAGQVAYVAIYAMDHDSKVTETVMSYAPIPICQTA